MGFFQKKEEPYTAIPPISLNVKLADFGAKCAAAHDKNFEETKDFCKNVGQLADTMSLKGLQIWQNYKRNSDGKWPTEIDDSNGGECVYWAPKSGTLHTADCNTKKEAYCI